MSRLKFGCPECGARECHREIDGIAGAGRTAIPVRGRWGRKRGEVWCENGCGCEDCVAYWKAQNEQFKDELKDCDNCGLIYSTQPCDVCGHLNKGGKR